MILTFEGKKYEGRALDCRSLSVDGRAVVAAVRGEDSVVSVDAPDPGLVHERVGYVRPGMSVATRTVLAAAARSRGRSAPQDEELATVRSKLEDLSVPSVSTRGKRQRAADDGQEAAHLRERVAELRGRLQAVRDEGGETAAIEERLSEAVRELSEVETQQVAAREQLAAARADAREARDVRERRMRLEDRKANLERAARAHLAEAVEPLYEDAVAAVPRRTPDDPSDASGVTAALAVARMADLTAPVVLACDRFEGPAAAAAWLDAPVVRL